LIHSAPKDATKRGAFYTKIDKKNLTPVWTVFGALITPEPRSNCVPVGWRLDDIRAAIMDVGCLITAKEAARRAAMLEPSLQST